MSKFAAKRKKLMSSKRWPISHLHRDDDCLIKHFILVCLSCISEAEKPYWWWPSFWTCLRDLQKWRWVFTFTFGSAVSGKGLSKIVNLQRIQHRTGCYWLIATHQCWVDLRYSWFATTWQGGHVGCQNKRIFPRRIYMKIEFSSQRREMLLFLTTNMAAVTSRANQQLKYGVLRPSWPGLSSILLSLSLGRRKGNLKHVIICIVLPESKDYLSDISVHLA